MILALDVGNSNIVISCIDDSKIYFTNRLKTDLSKTEDEYSMDIKNVLYFNKISVSEIEGAIVSSVVPPLLFAHKKAIKKILGFSPIIVDQSLDLGLSICIDNPNQIGNDLISAAVSGIENYPLPLIIIDIGTATTFTVINSKKELIGGIIYPGPKISLETLSNKTSQLPHIDPDAPKNVICANTVDCMKSGFVYGNASMIDGTISRIEKELGQKATSIATGGISHLIIPYCEKSIVYDNDLILKGLYSIYKKVKSKKNYQSLESLEK